MTTQAGYQFATHLKRARRAAGLSQAELAERAHYSTSYISLLERGQRSALRATAEMLADALGLQGDERAAFVAAVRSSGALAADEPAPVTLPAETAPGAVPHAILHDGDRAGAPTLPSGTVTFLFSDLAGSTRLLQQLGKARYAAVLDRHTEVARAAFAAHHGRVVDTQGDSFFAVFPTATDALAAAVDLQRGLASEPWPDLSPDAWPDELMVRVRIGLHTGAPLMAGDHYVGLDVHRAARIMAAGHGGQVLLSLITAELVRDELSDGMTLRDLGEQWLKDLQRPERVYQLEMPNQPSDFPALKTLDHQPDDLPLARPRPSGDMAAQKPAGPATRLPMGAYLGALPKTAIVAREGEVARLRTELDVVAGGEGRCVVLVGEAGVGKTRLAQEVTLAAHERGWLLATGSCDERSQGVAYYPFLQALSDAYAQAPTALRTEVGRRWPEVPHLIPELGAGLSSSGNSGHTSGGTDYQQRLFWQVASFLRELAAVQPLGVLLDDLHWADGASVALLAHLARQTRAYPILWLGTFRDREVGRAHPLNDALRDLGRAQLIERVAVRPLPLEGTQALIAAALGAQGISAEFTRLLHERAEGNAFFTQEWLQMLVQQRDASPAGAGWDQEALTEMTVPENVRAVIEQRVGQLSEATRDLLQAASVLGRNFGFADLWRMSGDEEASAEEELEEAVTAGVVHETGGDGYTFHHVLIQQAIYAELGGHRRKRLHRAAGEAIEGSGERSREQRAAELAWHFAEAGDLGRALPYAQRAGNQAEAIHAHAEAERHYWKAVELAREVGDQRAEAQALSQRGWMLDALMRHTEARTALTEAAQTYRTLGDQEGELRATFRLADVYAALGQHERGLRLCYELVARVPETPPSAGLIELYIKMAEVSADLRDFSTQRQCVEKANLLADQLGNERVRAEAAQAHGFYLIAFVSHLGEAEQAVQRAVDRAVASGRMGLAAIALNALAHIHLLEGKLDQSRAELSRMLTHTEQEGRVGAIIFGRIHRAFVAFWAGDWAAAASDIERAVGLEWTIEESYLRSYVALVRGILEIHMGWATEGQAHLEQAAAHGKQEVVWQARAVLAELQLLAGHPEEAVASLEPLVTLDEPTGKDIIFVAPRLAWAYLAVGKVEAATELLERFLAMTRAGAALLGVCEALLVRAMVATHQADWDEAKRSLDEAWTVTGDPSSPFAQLKLHYVYGQWHAARGEPALARERYEAALAICGRLGEALYRPHIERALAALGA